MLIYRSYSHGVAPPAGAWIETPEGSASCPGSSVAPPAGRGLKHGLGLTNRWASLSPPLRGRGLKPTRFAREEIEIVAPLRGRGLKLYKSYIPFSHHVVAPPAGAWIETCKW